MDDQVTVTVRREDQDLTVALVPTESGWHVLVALTEDSDEITLTDDERIEAIRLADDGLDETGLE